MKANIRTAEARKDSDWSGTKLVDPDPTEIEQLEWDS